MLFPREQLTNSPRPASNAFLAASLNIEESQRIQNIEVRGSPLLSLVRLSQQTRQLIPEGWDRPMRDARFAEVAFCLLASAGVLFAQEASQGQIGARQPVMVAQLTERVETAKAKSDEDAAKEIEHLELTERLNSPELARLIGELPGAKSKAALMAVGDASVFLESPQGEMLDKAAPDAAEQQQIVARASDYLKMIIPRLPNFYATRITNVFKREWTAQDKEGTHKPGALHFKGNSQATVLFREGKEVVRAEGAGQGGLTTRGTFGPVLSVVILDNLRSPMQWHGWEKGPNGAIAVFQFQVPQKDSHYEVSFPMGGLAVARRTGYLGEIGIDPDTGMILRVALQSDPVSGSDFVGHGDIMLEYGSVVIAGKSYTCLVHGVSMSTGSRWVGSHKTVAFIVLDDLVFTDYHVFRSESRILPN
jgi:hypothetical protein